MYPEDQAKEEYTEVERRSSQLPLTQQDKALAELHDTITQFAVRLKPVLTPEQERVGTEAEDKAAPSRSPVSEQLSTNNNSIHRASQRMRLLMDRLEC